MLSSLRFKIVQNVSILLFNITTTCYLTCLVFHAYICMLYVVWIDVYINHYKIDSNIKSVKRNKISVCNVAPPHSILCNNLFIFYEIF